MLDSFRWTNFTALDAYCRANLATPPWRLQLGKILPRSMASAERILRARWVLSRESRRPL